MSARHTARRVDRGDYRGYGYELLDAAGEVVETGVIRLSEAQFAAFPDGRPGFRLFSTRPTSDGVLGWLAENGPEAGPR